MLKKIDPCPLQYKINRMKNAVFFILAFLLSVPAFGQRGSNFVDSLEQTLGGLKENLVKIKDGYYVISPEGWGGNIGVYAGSNGVILVDPQWSRMAPRIKELIRTISDHPVKYVINSHYHFDHVDGNKAFGREGVAIVAHQNLYQRLASDQLLSETPAFGKILQKAYPQEGLPSITFSDFLELRDGSETVRIMHFKNAHTDGDAIVHFVNADIYHTGDIFVTYGYPFIDEDNGGDVYATIRAVEYLISVSDSETKIIPGHGQVSTIDDLVRYKNLLTSVRDQVANQVKQGITLEKILAEVKLEEGAGGYRANFIPHVYRMALRHEKLNN